ncbi:hypothetical protein N7466_000848 [Penicillium verhagenii]|uniref:uncharacterized protein n=1 Tax=Penicillium verhagenii TaxID=1562060 RepID=UPI00254530C3|nr:uncharacterized protein N7466_000848 [Penicillium verhagenii]KAJ5947833.1 hypothetical protein N7466_000848 [Penicillium verhagenii]
MRGVTLSSDISTNISSSDIITNSKATRDVGGQSSSSSSRVITRSQTRDGQAKKTTITSEVASDETTPQKKLIVRFPARIVESVFEENVANQDIDHDMPDAPVQENGISRDEFIVLPPPTTTPANAIPPTTTPANALSPATTPANTNPPVTTPAFQFHGNPLAWAETRQSLCDSLEWYRSVQGSAYQKDGVCYGLLFDGDCGTRFHIDDEVIITRVGGGYAKSADGVLRLAKNQRIDEYPAKAINFSLNNNIPVGVVLGRDNNDLGGKLPHRYNVLSYFRVTDMWYEQIDGFIGLKFRLEKIDMHEKSWWADAATPNPLSYRARYPFTLPEIEECPHCAFDSPQVFQEGWMCLEDSCPEFWKMNGASAPTNLTYHHDWLKARRDPSTVNPPKFELIPNAITEMCRYNKLASTLRDNWRGIVCPLCYKCIQRTQWNGWKCTTDPLTQSEPGACQFTLMVSLRPVPITSVFEPQVTHLLGNGMRKFKGAKGDSTSCWPYIKRTYPLPGIGSVTHFVATRAVWEQPEGVNYLFDTLQREKLGLERYPLNNAVVTGMLTSHFAVNYGMPYKYVVSVRSKGFDEAPECILRALGRLTWATQEAVTAAGEKALLPNELLALGYFQGMKIGQFHDDGESSLGPTIATLSLGASSTMKIRMKGKSFHGQSARHVPLNPDPVPPGCQHEISRRRLKEKFNTGSITKEEYNRRRAELFRHSSVTGLAPVSIHLHLQHGDLVVMHGEGLQQYYEHSVESLNSLRFALTARYIKPDDLNQSELQKGQFTLTADQVYKTN